MLRQQTTEEDAAVVESMNRARGQPMNAFQRFSRRNIHSSSAGGGAAATRTARRSASSSRQGATQAPVWGVHGNSTGGGASQTQRPVAIDKPVRL